MKKPDTRLTGTYTPIDNEVEARQAYDKHIQLGWISAVGDFNYSSWVFKKIVKYEPYALEYGEFLFGFHSLDVLEETDTLLPLADLLAMEPEENLILKALNELSGKYPYKKEVKESQLTYKEGVADAIELCIQEVERVINSEK